MGEGFAVHHKEMAGGAQALARLPGQAAALAQRMQRTLTGLAGAAGHEGLAAALMQTNILNARRLVELSALYEHIQQSLDATARDYAGSDNTAAQRVRASGSRAS